MNCMVQISLSTCVIIYTDIQTESHGNYKNQAWICSYLKNEENEFKEFLPFEFLFCNRNVRKRSSVLIIEVIKPYKSIE